MVADPRIGTEVAGYRIESLIGRGGMSVVYLAEHLRLGRKVALKLLAPELTETEGFRERFIKESRLAASLEHPNIIPIYDADEADGVLYIAMRYVEGTDLKALIRREGTLDPQRTLSMITQIARGLDAAHAKGLVHRDVKPGNVLIAAGGDEETPAHCYVCDFGLTKQALSVSGLTETGQFVGTIDYVAPEQIQGLAVDRRADVYSLGCVLYECLAGVPPFRRGQEVAVIWAHVQEPPPKVTDARSDLPPGIDEVVARAMAKKPEDRYASCGDLAADARGELGVASGELTGLTGPRTRPVGIAAERARTRRRIMAAAALGAVAVAAVAFALLTRGGGGEVPPITDQSLVRVDPATNEVASVVAVGSQPESVAFGEEGLWVANFGDKTVQQIDAETNEVLRTQGGITGNPTGLAVGGGFVWITNAFAGTVIKLDATTGATTSIDVGTGAKGVAFGEGAVWVVNNQNNTLSRIDPASEAVTVVELAEFTEEGQETGPAAVAVGAGSVWVSNSLGQSVWRFDPSNLDAEPVRINLLQGNPGSLTFGQGALWVTNPDGDSIVRIDPADNGQVTVPCTCNNPVGIGAGGGAVWVSSGLDGKLTRIDPRSRRVVTEIQLGFSPAGVALSPGAVWVAVHGT
jgi:DNA-binding beta-propeller fold protein YncE